MLIKILRWLLGIGIATWAVFSVRATIAGSSQFDANTALHFGLASLALVAAAALIAPDLARILSRPLLVLIESLYMPTNQADKPPLTFRLGRYYAANGRLADAEKDYKRMLGFYPAETDGWIELMTLYWTWKPQPREREAQKAYHRADRKVSAGQERTRLKAAMNSLKKGERPADFAILAAQDKAQAQTPASD
ncbi:MAG: tetratricopeptide (TPR) repeat protein [Verrucomicrobiales bacterium]|jgi:tetratricopeptide (TPR) repeat protein